MGTGQECKQEEETVTLRMKRMYRELHHHLTTPDTNTFRKLSGNLRQSSLQPVIVLRETDRERERVSQKSLLSIYWIQKNKRQQCTCSFCKVPPSI
jgi:hypothetical protein